MCSAVAAKKAGKQAGSCILDVLSRQPNPTQQGNYKPHTNLTRIALQASAPISNAAKMYQTPGSYPMLCWATPFGEINPTFFRGFYSTFGNVVMSQPYPKMY